MKYLKGRTMLSALMTYEEEKGAAEQFAKEIQLSRRDQREDLKLALDYLYAFKDKLSYLHPSVLPIIETMLKAEF